MTATIERTAIAVDQPALQLATAWVSKAIPRKAPAPALAGILLHSGDGELKLAGYDWSTYCSATVDADGELGDLLVPGHLLADIAAGAERTAVTMDTDGSQLLVRAGRDRHRLRLMLAEEYPTVPPVPAERGAAYDLPAALARVAGGAGDAPIGDHQVQCLCLSASGGTLTLYATQSARFARASVDWDGEDFELLVDARRLLDLAKPLGPEIRLGWSDNLLSLADSSRTAVLNLNAGKFTPTKRLAALFAQSPIGGTADVDRDELLAALAQAGYYADGPFGAVDLTFADEAVSLASAAEEVGDYNSAVAAHLDMPRPVEMRVTRHELVDALRTVPAEVVRISIGALAGTPCLTLAGLTGGQVDPTTTHVIAPRIRRTT